MMVYVVILFTITAITFMIHGYSIGIYRRRSGYIFTILCILGMVVQIILISRSEV